MSRRGYEGVPGNTKRPCIRIETGMVTDRGGFASDLLASEARSKDMHGTCRSSLALRKGRY
ncbi:hypothetical protein KAM380_016950 [Aeromonas caviae]|nr:hypothetical protein KAM380_016950 [Aeromonas caviae]